MMPWDCDNRFPAASSAANNKASSSTSGKSPLLCVFSFPVITGTAGGSTNRGVVDAVDDALRFVEPFCCCFNSFSNWKYQLESHDYKYDNEQNDY